MFEWGCGGQAWLLGGVGRTGEPGDGWQCVAAEGHRTACGGWEIITPGRAGRGGTVFLQKRKTKVWLLL